MYGGEVEKAPLLIDITEAGIANADNIHPS